MPSVMLSEVSGAPWLLDESSTDASAALEEQGLIVVPSAVSAAAALAVQVEAVAALKQTLELPLHESARFLGEIRSPLFRHDVKLAIVPAVAQLLLEFSSSRAAQAIASSIGTNAALCELSCIISEHGAQTQPPHADTPAREQDAKTAHHRALAKHGSRLFSVFVALGNISPCMGATLMWPGTHTVEFQDELERAGGALLRSRMAVHMDLEVGGAVVMDSRLWHCGGANLSGADGGLPQQRCLLVLSFAQPAFFPQGPTYSLLPSLAGRLSLLNMRRAMEAVLEGCSSEALRASSYLDLAAGDCQGVDAYEEARASLARKDQGPRATLALPLVHALLKLASSQLPANEPRAKACLWVLETALEAAASASEERAALPKALLRTLSTYRVLGPHLLSSHEWVELQAGVEDALRSSTVDAPACASGSAEAVAPSDMWPSREILRERWLKAHEGLEENSV